MQLAIDVPRHASSLASRSITCSCERCERTRVREHILGAIEEVLARPGATAEARASRIALVAELVRYAVRGVFPRNETVPDRNVPIFVDRVGTRCAVAHLLDHTGEHALVDDVTRTANGAFVPELVRDVRLRSWLDRWHLTEAEAARIQPSYCCPDLDPVASCACGFPGGLGALFTGVVAVDAGTEEATLTVDAAYGDATVAPGDVVSGWTELSYVYAGDGQRVLGSQDGDGFHLLYAFEEGTDDMIVTDTCEAACQPVTNAPYRAPLAAFVSVAEGASCDETFSALEDWGIRNGDADTPPCNGEFPAGSGGAGGDPTAASTAAGSTSTVAGSGGAPADGSGGSGEAVDGGSSDGCGCGVGPGALDPTTQGLLWALTAGIVLARRRMAPRF